MKRTTLAMIVIGASWWALGAGQSGGAGRPPLQPTSRSETRPTSQAATQPSRQLTLDLEGGVKLELVLVPAGRFLMGSPEKEKDFSYNERPQHEVTISRPFYMGVCEVTRGAFARFALEANYRTEDETLGRGTAWNGTRFDPLTKGASWRNPGFEQTDAHPVVNVSRDDAMAFCQWLSKRTGRAVGLPTEAQWEYACRAGTKTAFPWGNEPDGGKGWANATDQSLKKAVPPAPHEQHFSWDDGYTFTAPVGKFKANAFGLHDMIGNVEEWCLDAYYHDYRGAKGLDPVRSFLPDHTGVVRGGHWCSAFGRQRSASRAPGTADPTTGFRVAVDVK